MFFAFTVISFPFLTEKERDGERSKHDAVHQHVLASPSGWPLCLRRHLPFLWQIEAVSSEIRGRRFGAWPAKEARELRQWRCWERRQWWRKWYCIAQVMCKVILSKKLYSKYWHMYNQKVLLTSVNVALHSISLLQKFVIFFNILTRNKFYLVL